jgi:hypothetical protein
MSAVGDGEITKLLTKRYSGIPHVPGITKFR